MTRTLFFESEPDSSLTGPGAVSGEEIAGAVLGELLFGTTTGASAGVAELDGMPAGVSGVAALVGGCGKFGAPTGTDSGALAGVVAGDVTGVGRLTGEGIGEDPFADGLRVGETDCAGGFAGVVAGDFAGETDGDFAGGVDNGGEIAGVDVGGDKAGDFEGDAGEIVGVYVGGDKAGEVVGEVAGECEGLVGEVDGEGEFVGVGVGFGFGDGEGALSACTKPLLCETETHKTKMESTTRQCIIIFFVWKHTQNLKKKEKESVFFLCD